MKKIIIITTFLFSICNFSQTNSSKVSPVHTGSFSNNNISYIVGKIYVLPQPISIKQINVKNIVTNNIKIHPNPVTNILNIETLDNTVIKFITIFDMNGKLLYSDKLESNMINLSFLKQGFYTLKLDNDNAKTFKIIKN